MNVEETDERERAVAETQARTVTQQAIEDEMERLLEENEDLKV